MIVEAHRLSHSNPDNSAAEVIMGLGGRRGGPHVSLGLQTFTANSLRDQAAVSNEKRKAAEEQRLKKAGQGAGGK